MVVTVLLGFVAAWHHDFGSKDAPILNRMVLVYVVPLALFAGLGPRFVSAVEAVKTAPGKTSR
jgi:predicted permease